MEVRDLRVAVAGFPYVRRNIRGRFPDVLGQTGWRAPEDAVRILAMHHCVEGATVGPSDFTFTITDDVVRCSDLPDSVAVVLSGHIHRQQVLCTDLDGRDLPAPVIYPGSVERTAFAEKGEVKGYMILTLEGGPGGGRVIRHEFRELYARPMVELDLTPKGAEGVWTREALLQGLRQAVDSSVDDSILRVRLEGTVPADAQALLSAASLRNLAPASMNLDLIGPNRPQRWREGRLRRGKQTVSSPQMDLGLDLSADVAGP